MLKKEKIDLVILLVYPIIASILSLLFNINAIGSIILFFGLPSLYLSIKGKEYIIKAIIFSIIASVPLIIIIDYIAHITEQWIIPDSILPYRLFGIVTFEVIIWAILNLYYVVLFYEYFLDKHVTKRQWHPRMKYLTLIVLLLFFLFISIYFFFPSLLKIPYWYWVFGTILFIIPIGIQFYSYPKLILKFIKTGVYFFYLTFTYEITALQLGWWGFPGDMFIGWIFIFNIKFPLEELIFWIIIFAIATLTYYEFFDDDEK